MYNFSAFDAANAAAASEASADEDPRISLRRKLEVREKLIKVIEERLLAQPEDRHQRFLLQEHQAARAALSEALRRLNERLDARYQDLETYVAEYVQQLEQPPPAPAAGLDEREREARTWQELIDKVRARLVKRPGDPRLMRLLAEHQARLLRITESRAALGALPPHSGYDGTHLVLENLAAPDIAPESGPEPIVEAPESGPLAALLQEREVFAGMVEKTRQRLAAKPELVHLKALIQQHEARLQALDAQIAESRSAADAG